MYLGHFFLWIGAGILFRSQQVYNQENCAPACSVDSIIPGPMALRLAGWPGLFAILFASWSTANPFLYAGGLGLKSGVAALGVLATVVSLFPGLVKFFLIFVQVGGTLLVP